MILGLDWLERFSPTRVHRAQKCMHTPYQGSYVCLQEIVPELPTDSLVLLSLVDSLEPSHAQCVDQLPPKIQDLINLFAHVFEAPSSAPPSRTCDHAIPLLPGSRPVIFFLIIMLQLLRMKLNVRCRRCWLRVSSNTSPVSYLLWWC